MLIPGLSATRSRRLADLGVPGHLIGRLTGCLNSRLICHLIRRLTNNQTGHYSIAGMRYYPALITGFMAAG